MYDVIIIGGGPSGLSAALVLGRAMRKVLVIDNEKARNFVVNQSHGFLTRDSVPPKELRQLAKQELAKYETVHFMKMTAEKLKKEGKLFTIWAGNRTYDAKKIIIATGLKERLPSIAGLEKVYGSFIFSCPYCDGWEHRNKKLAIIGNGSKLLNYVKLIRQWSHEVFIATNGLLTCSKDDQIALKNSQIPILEYKITKIYSQQGKLYLQYSNGQVNEYDAGFLLQTNAVQHSDLPEQLGIKYVENGSFATGNHGRTMENGLYIIGDAAKRFTGLIGAASDGYEAGIHINQELVEDEWGNMMDL